MSTTRNKLTAPNDERADRASSAREATRISPLYNDVFLMTFGKSETAARASSNAVLRSFGIDEIGTVTSIKADATEPSAIGVKASRCDVVLVADDRIVDLEAQRYKVNFDNKSLFYASKLLVSNTPKGTDNDYKRMPQVIVIMLIEGHDIFKGDQFATLCHMTWDRDEGAVPGSDRIAVIAIELDKVAEAYNKGVTEEVLSDELSAWLYVLSRGYRNQREVDEIMGSFPTIEEWAAQYGVAIDDPQIKEKYENYWLDVLEYNSIIETAKDDGRQAGMREGKQAGMREGMRKGMREGKREGMREGKQAGMREGREAVAAQLRNLGVAEDTIAEALRRAEVEGKAAADENLAQESGD